MIDPNKVINTSMPIIEDILKTFLYLRNYKLSTDDYITIKLTLNSSLNEEDQVYSFGVGLDK